MNLIEQIKNDIHRGFWCLGETGFIGSSWAGKKYRRSGGITLITLPYWMPLIGGREYGLSRHVLMPVDGDYTGAYQKEKFERLLSCFHVKDAFINDEGQTVRGHTISAFSDLAHGLEKDEIEQGFIRLIQVMTNTPESYYVGDPDWALHLLNMGIGPQSMVGLSPGNTVCTGYSNKTGLWCGFSHRGWCGFKVGSTVKKGDCAYNPETFDEWVDDAKRFYELPFHETDEKQLRIYGTEEDGEPSGACIDLAEFTPGKGEWTAYNSEDARQMALDYAAAVS